MQTKFLLAPCICLLISSSALAKDLYNHVMHHEYKARTGHGVVVTSSNGETVRSENGECVRSEKWGSKTDNCTMRCDISGMAESLIQFGFNSSSLSKASKKNLDKMIKHFKTHKITSIKIVGHADAIGSDSYNYKLSKARAEAVKKYIANKIKMRSINVEISGAGSSNSISDCDADLTRSAKIACLAPDRRVELMLDYKE